MINLLFGISLTLNVVFIVGIILYFKIKTFGLKKVQKEFADKYFASDDEIDNFLDKL